MDHKSLNNKKIGGKLGSNSVSATKSFSQMSTASLFTKNVNNNRISKTKSGIFGTIQESKLGKSLSTKDKQLHSIS